MSKPGLAVFGSKKMVIPDAFPQHYYFPIIPEIEWWGMSSDAAPVEVIIERETWELIEVIPGYTEEFEWGIKTIYPTGYYKLLKRY